ncbi:MULTISPECIES: choice-of-anchor J family PEP-CTERM protein [unclassified Duganella]|uniref:choice-of-anchor J family PEP-CTERM protein n=1 Tax=unclassified Duganella TaxID=2636909 RepID=UPI001313E6F3|nr:MULTISPECIES: choice-of-anchor J domain-containing protein [unclassified Duganella]
MDLIKRWAGLLAVAAGFTASTSAAPLLSEGFNNIAALPANGWVMVNNSSPPGSTAWFQGLPAVFPAAAGPADSYIAANLNNAAFGGAVSNWLLTPELALSNGESLNFDLRLLGEGFLDTVEVYLSTAGASANVGASPTSTGDFALLGTFSSSADTGWVGHSLSVGGLTSPASGRFAFRYVVNDTSLNGDFVGIDTVVVNATAIPEPGTIALTLLGFCAMSGVLRLRRPRRWLALSSLSVATVAAAQTAPDNGLMTFPHVTVVAQPVPPQTAAQDAGFKAYKDPVTGQLTSPTPAQVAELEAAISTGRIATKSRATPHKPIYLPRGGVGMVLDESTIQYATTRKESAAQGEQK